MLTRQQSLDNYKLLLSQTEKAEEKTMLMRELAERDLFYLAVYVLKREDLNCDWMYARIREIEAEPNGYIDIWAREHGKSSVITFLKSIDDIIKNPNVTIGIFSFTRPLAKNFLRQIKLELEENALLHELWPDIFWKNPAKQSPKWSEDEGLLVRREANKRQMTVEAYGLTDSQPTGPHFDIRVYDDVVTQASVNTPEMMFKTTNSYELSQFLGEKDGVQRYAGTFYHHADTSNQIIDRGVLKPRIYPATVDGTADGELVFLSQKRYNELRASMTEYNFNAQLLCNPSADSIRGFDKAWLNYWPAHHFNNLNLYLLCDPASSQKKDSDYSVFMVVGVGPDENYYVVTMVRDRLSLTQKADTLFALYRQYKPKIVGYEKYGMQSDIEHYKERMNRENFRFHITELGGKTKKEDRIGRLEPLFKQGKIYLPETCVRVNHEGKAEDLTKVFVDSEYSQFPFPRHDDMLDCLARIFDIHVSAPDADIRTVFANIAPDNPDEAQYSVLDHT